MPHPGTPIESLSEAMEAAYPELAAIRAAAAAGGLPAYLVGGAVRDLLLGRGRADLDVVVGGEAEALAERLGAEPTAHERFGTAKVRLDGHEIDLAAARTESYSHPGALPEVSAAGSIEQDLGRRDFSINAMAVPLHEQPRLIDPHGGAADLEAGRLRALHSGSFADDPTRALRAARYAARFGFGLEGETARLLAATDLGTVSADRRRAELLRLAAEATAPEGFELLVAWGLIDLAPGGPELARRVGELLAAPPWRDFAPRPEAVLAAAVGGEAAALAVAGLPPAAVAAWARAEALAATRPERPSAAVELARGHDPVELALARALGAEWLDRYLTEWRQVGLEIGGEDLIAAGVPEGPAVGRGLAAALRSKLDGDVTGREQELAAALAAANRS